MQIRLTPRRTWHRQYIATDGLKAASSVVVSSRNSLKTASREAGGQFCSLRLVMHSGRRPDPSDKSAGDLAQGGKPARRMVSIRCNRRLSLTFCP